MAPECWPCYFWRLLRGAADLALCSRGRCAGRRRGGAAALELPTIADLAHPAGGSEQITGMRRVRARRTRRRSAGARAGANTGVVANSQSSVFQKAIAMTVERTFIDTLVF